MKLGYGGTKTEMARLIKDASQMKDVQKELGITVDENSMSFDNIVNAISVMQKQMGITGTTSKEASMTITGSVNAMKGAWTNLIAGIADDNANFEQLVNNFVESIIGKDGEGGVLNNILPRIQVIVDQIPTVFTSLATNLLPQLLEMGANLITNLVNGISQNLPQIMTTINQVVNTILNVIVQNLPQLIQMGIQIIVSLVQGIAQNLPTLIPAMVDAVITIVEALIDNIDLIIEAGIQLILGLADGLIEAIPRLIEKAPVIINKLVSAFVQNFPKVVKAGGELIGKLAMGIIGSVAKIAETAPKLIKSLVNGLKQGFNQIKNIGKYLVEGLWDGISGMGKWVLDKIKGFGKSILKGLKGVLGIKSPSTVFRDEVGKNIALGVGEGFTDEMANVNKEMASAINTDYDLGSSVTGSSVGSSIFNYENMVNAFMEALSQMTVEMDDETMGKFVNKTVAKAIYS